MIASCPYAAIRESQKEQRLSVSSTGKKKGSQQLQLLQGSVGARTSETLGAG